MIIPSLYRFLRPWLFLAIYLPFWGVTAMVVGIIILITPPRDAEGEPLNLEDVDL